MSSDLAILAHQKLEHEVELLKEELAAIRSEGKLAKGIKRFQPLAAALVGVAGFVFGVVQYTNAESSRLAQQKKAEEDRLAQQKEAEANRAREQEAANATFQRTLKRETARPLWEKRLALYIDAATATATIATKPDGPDRKAAEERFWVLYYGPLATVEDIESTDGAKNITGAMVSFGAALKNGADKDKLQGLSLALAHAVRKAITPGFDVKP